MASYLDLIPPEVGAMIQTYVDHETHKKACRNVVEKMIFILMAESFQYCRDARRGGVFREELEEDASLTELIALQTQKLYAFLYGPDYQKYVALKDVPEQESEDDSDYWIWEYEHKLVSSVFPTINCLHSDSAYAVKERLFEMLRDIQ